MKTTLAVLVLALTANVAGQSRKQFRTPAMPASAVSRPDLNATITDLEKAAEATHSDISNMRIDKWGAAWKPGFLAKGTHQQQAQQTAVSLKRNLVGALPLLINQVRASRGSMAATFKLYDDLSVVCEALDSLLSATETYGKKEEYAPLANDFSALGRIRRNLSSYIQLQADAVEGKSNGTYARSAALHAPQRSTSAGAPKKIKTITDERTSTVQSPGAQSPGAQSSATQLPKKIVVDDNATDPKPVKKKATVQYSNL